MIANLLKQLFSKLREEIADVSEEQVLQLGSEVQKLIESEPPPRVAVIGKAGVGKSTTLNVLFDAGQEVNHFEACTPEPKEISAMNGDLIVYDMPGLGQSQKTEKKHIEMYKKVLNDVDVALWVLDAHDRSIADIQRYIRLLKKMNPSIVNKMVFAANKADLLDPNDWNRSINLPSKEQELNIKGRVANIEKLIREALPTWKGSVIVYSAKQYYYLPELFLAILKAVPKERQWVLNSKKALANFLDHVDERFLPPDVVKKHSPKSLENKKTVAMM